ncbi:MAG: MFS transporter [Bacteroidia bacterium]|nr:MFS transporter [Bacteroidia bacterium]MBP9688365.1 MFS transporter [Bacteroidia bacterium]
MSLNNSRLLPLKNKEFKLFLTTRASLTIALQIQAVIAGWHIYKLTGDPLSLGLIGLAEAIPAISIALYAGHVADISSKRKILVNSLLMLMFCSVGLTAVSSDLFVFGFSESWSVNAMYMFIFISGFARGFYAPAGFSFIVQLVEKQQLVTASTLNSSVWQMAAILGPALGGALYALVGITYTFFVVLFFTLIALTALLNIKPKPIASKMGAETISFRLKEGLRFVFNNKVVLSAISLDLFAVLFGGAVALLPVFAKEILAVGPQGLGLLRAAPSLGASITMIWLSMRSPIEKPGIVLLFCVAAFGLSMIGFALSTSFYLSIFMLFLSGAFDSVSVIIRGNILQLQTPDEMRGRVSAVNSMFIGSSNEIGSFESGVAAKLLGTVPSVVFGGCVTLLVVGITSIKAPQLKRFKY